MRGVHQPRPQPSLSQGDKYFKGQSRNPITSCQPTLFAKGEFNYENAKNNFSMVHDPVLLVCRFSVFGVSLGGSLWGILTGIFALGAAVFLFLGR